MFMYNKLLSTEKYPTNSVFEFSFTNTFVQMSENTLMIHFSLSNLTIEISIVKIDPLPGYLRRK